jgi:hypothetical protein
MKSQGSEASDPETLQSQNRPYAGNRLSISALAVVHGRLTKLQPERLSNLVRPKKSIKESDA